MGLLDIKPNIPKANIAAYTFVIAGIPKIGKTTLFYDLIMKHLKDPMKGILLATETGYKALAGLIAKDINDWDEFVTAVDELVDEREKMPFEFIGIDTIDVLVDMAGKQVLREWNRDNSDEKKRTYQDIPFGKGHEKAKDKIMEQLDRLVKTKYGLFIITHSTEKKVKQKGGEEYDQLQPSLPGKTGIAVENMADFLIFATTYQEKNGEVKRWLHYRNNGYIKAGGRFTNVPDKVEFTLPNFLEVFNGAISGAFDGTVDIEKIAAEQATQANQDAKEYVEAVKDKKNPETLIKQIDAKIKAMDTDTQSSVAKVFKKIANTTNYKSVTNIDHLTEMLEACGV